ITQRIAEVVEHVHRTQPERAMAFTAKLDWYERRLGRLKISDSALALFPQRDKLVGQSLSWTALAVLGAPIAVYGWAHRLLPHLLVKWAKRKLTHPEKRKAQASTAAMEAGMIAYVVCYGIYGAIA